MSFSVLPDETLRLIMTHVPLMERLRKCSLVCRAFHKAAASAGAASLDLEALVDDGSKGFEEWLSRHGDDVTSLRLLKSEAPTYLPCSNLLELDLNWCGSIQLQKSDCNPGLLQSCRGLTKLKFRMCYVIEGSSVSKELAGLSCLPSLQHLDICRLGPDAYMQLSSSALKTLTNLTHLDLFGPVDWAEELKQDFSCLVQLQVLSIRCQREVNFVVSDRKLDMCGTKGWSAFTCLEKLELEDSLLDAAELCAAANLRTVLLTRCGLCSSRTGRHADNIAPPSLIDCLRHQHICLSAIVRAFDCFVTLTRDFGTLRHAMGTTPSSWPSSLTAALLYCISHTSLLCTVLTCPALALLPSPPATPP